MSKGDIKRDDIKRYGVLSLSFGIISVVFSPIMAFVAMFAWGWIGMDTGHEDSVGEYIVATILTIVACAPMAVALVSGNLRLRSGDIKDGREMAVAGVCLALAVLVFCFILFLMLFVR